MGAEGWGYQDILPYFIKMENNFAAELDEGIFMQRTTLKLFNQVFTNLI